MVSNCFKYLKFELPMPTNCQKIGYLEMSVITLVVWALSELSPSVINNTSVGIAAGSSIIYFL
jgi:hypothetical protein